MPLKPQTKTMEKDQIDAIISLGPLIVGAVGTTVVSVFGVVKYFDYLVKYNTSKFSEQSLGATKILEYDKVNRSVDNEIDQIKVGFEIQEKRLDQLDRDYKEMVNRVLDFYKSSK